MEAYRDHVRDRVLRARRALADAAVAGGHHALGAAVDELEDALSVARAHDVRVPGPADRAPEHRAAAEAAREAGEPAERR